MSVHSVSVCVWADYVASVHQCKRQEQSPSSDVLLNAKTTIRNPAARPALEPKLCINHVLISLRRQLGQRCCAPERIQPPDAGRLPPSHRNKRQRLPGHEQHQHPDHPGVLLRQQKHHPLLQRGALRPTGGTQHRGPDRHTGLYRHSLGYGAHLWTVLLG